MKEKQEKKVGFSESQTSSILNISDADSRPGICGRLFILTFVQQNNLSWLFDHSLIPEPDNHVRSFGQF